MYGQNQHFCLQREAENEQPKADEGMNSRPNFSNITRPEVVDDFGPWMLVRKNLRRKKNIPAKSTRGTPMMESPKGAQEKTGSDVEPRAQSKGSGSDLMVTAAVGSRFQILDTAENVEKEDSVANKDKSASPLLGLSDVKKPLFIKDNKMALNGPNSSKEHRTISGSTHNKTPNPSASNGSARESSPNLRAMAYRDSVCNSGTGDREAVTQANPIAISILKPQEISNVSKDLSKPIEDMDVKKV